MSESAPLLFQLEDFSECDAPERLPLFASESERRQFIAGQSFGRYRGAAEPQKVLIQLYGHLSDGRSVAVRVRNFWVHFTVEVPERTADPSNFLITLRRACESAVAADTRFPEARVRCESYTAASAYGFEPGLPDSNGLPQRRINNYVRVHVDCLGAAKNLTYSLKKSGYGIFEEDTVTGVKHRAHVAAGLLVEALGATVYSWLEITGSHTVNASPTGRFKYTTCAVEVTLDDWKSLTLRPDVKRVIRPSVLGFDIEALMPKGGGFANPFFEECAAFCIGNVFMSGDGLTTEFVCFYFGGSERKTLSDVVIDESRPDEKFRLELFTTEAAMLEAWRDYVCEKDPDLITGFNTFKFDNGYLKVRARALKVHNFFRLSRVLTDRVDSRSITYDTDTGSGNKSTLSSVALGDNIMDTFDAEGRIEVDCFMVIKTQSQIKFKQNGLQFVAREALGLTKKDLGNREMNKRHADGDFVTVAQYCVRDAQLCPMLLKRFNIIPDMIEMARVTRTPFKTMATSGKSIMNRNLLFNESHLMGLALNKKIKETKTKYEGAIVLDPVVGFYTTPTATLDYMSLYPSCIQLKNLCMSTLVLNPAYLPLIPPSALQTIRIGEGETARDVHFVQHLRGVIPHIEDKLLAARAVAKKDLAAAKKSGASEQEIACLDSRQLALKQVANSLYGFTGSISPYRQQEIAEATTAIGREALQATAASVWELERGKSIYGDTDSVFVQYEGANTVAEAFARAKVSSDRVTASGKLVLQLEKVYGTLILLGKKRYVGLKFMGPDDPSPTLDYKGIELVRKDAFLLYQSVLSEVVDALVRPGPEVPKAERIRNGVNIVEACLRRLSSGLVTMEDVVQTKSLKAVYKDNSAVQKAVNERIRARAPGSEYKVGDRVPFVVLRSPSSDLKTASFLKPKQSSMAKNSCSIAERAEHPDFIRENGLESQIDWLYYLERLQHTLFDLLGKNNASLAALFTCHKQQLARLYNKQADIRTFSTPGASKKRPLEGPVAVPPAKRQAVEPVIPVGKVEKEVSPPRKRQRVTLGDMLCRKK